MDTRPVAITMGDACGIGPEIVLKACAALDGAVPLVVYGDPGVLRRQADAFGLAVRVEAVDAPPAHPAPAERRADERVCCLLRLYFPNGSGHFLGNGAGMVGEDCALG